MYSNANSPQAFPIQLNIKDKYVCHVLSSKRDNKVVAKNRRQKKLITYKKIFVHFSFPFLFFFFFSCFCSIPIVPIRLAASHFLFCYSAPFVAISIPSTSDAWVRINSVYLRNNLRLLLVMLTRVSRSGSGNCRMNSEVDWRQLYLKVIKKEGFLYRHNRHCHSSVEFLLFLQALLSVQERIDNNNNIVLLHSIQYSIAGSVLSRWTRANAIHSTYHRWIDVPALPPEWIKSHLTNVIQVRALHLYKSNEMMNLRYTFQEKKKGKSAFLVHV